MSEGFQGGPQQSHDKIALKYVFSNLSHLIKYDHWVGTIWTLFCSAFVLVLLSIDTRFFLPSLIHCRWTFLLGYIFAPCQNWIVTSWLNSLTVRRTWQEAELLAYFLQCLLTMKAGDVSTLFLQSRFNASVKALKYVLKVDMWLQKGLLTRWKFSPGIFPYDCLRHKIYRNVNIWEYGYGCYTLMYNNLC